MAVRELDATDDILTMSAGTIGAFGNGGWSIIGIIKPTSLTSAAYISVGAGTNPLISSMWDNSDTNLAVATQSEYAGGNANQTAGDWQILGITKPTGTSTPTVHRKVLGSGSWTHTTSGTTIAANATSADIIGIGSWASGNRQPMRIASAAIYMTELSQANVESVQTTPSTQQLIDLSPVAAWDFNQLSTATDVLDLIGTADQNAITGTTVIGGDDPTGWTFGSIEVVPGGGRGLVRPGRHRGRWPSRDTDWFT